MTLLDQFAAAGVRFERTRDGALRALGPLTDDLRTAIRANKPALLEELAANDPDIDPGVSRRRSRALALLAERPEQRIAVIAEPGDPAHVTVAIRDGSVGDIEITAERYDGFRLLELMGQYGTA